jgi:hypothetical protein
VPANPRKNQLLPPPWGVRSEPSYSFIFLSLSLSLSLSFTLSVTQSLLGHTQHIVPRRLKAKKRPKREGERKRTREERRRRLMG